MITYKRLRLAITLAAITSGIIATLPAHSVQIETPEAKPQSPIQVIIDTAQKYGIAPNDMLAISAQESSLGKFKSGDKGCSLGWFHINTCSNKGTAELIGDPQKEAEWVAIKLTGYGYHTDRILAFARYNAPAYPNYEYAKQVEKRLGELDLFLKPYQTAPEGPKP